MVEELSLRVTRLRARRSVWFVPNGDIRRLANTSRGLGRAVVDLTLPGLVGRRPRPGPDGHRGGGPQVATSERSPRPAPNRPVVTFIDSTEKTLTLRVTLRTSPASAMRSPGHCEEASGAALGRPSVARPAPH